MPDLKAAAAWARSEEKYAQEDFDSAVFHDECGGTMTRMVNARLAAQALEAWAWQQERKAGVGPGWTDSGWRCEVDDQEYDANTPLGAVLAAMEGEKNG